MRQKPPQAENKGMKKLRIKLTPKEKSVRITVVLTPSGSDWKEKKTPQITPLSDW